LAIIKLIEERPGITSSTIAEEMELHIKTVQRHLRAIAKGNGIMMHNGGDYLYIEQYQLTKKKLGSHTPYQYTILK